MWLARIDRLSSTALLALIAGACCVSCTPSSGPATPPAPPTAPPPGPTAATNEGPKPASKPRDAAAELLAKLQPQGKTPPAPQPREIPAPERATTGPSLLPAEEVAKLPGVAGLGTELGKALAAGDLGAAEKLTLGGEELGRLIAPAYRDILLHSVEEQNRATLTQLIETLRGKRLESETIPGPVARALPRGPFVEGSLIMTGAKLRLSADGIRLEIGLDQLLLVGDAWKIFRLGQP